jgi:hypothetical protein
MQRSSHETGEFRMSNSSVPQFWTSKPLWRKYIQPRTRLRSNKNSPEPSRHSTACGRWVCHVRSPPFAGPIERRTLMGSSSRYCSFVIGKSRVQIQVRRPAIVHSWVFPGPLNILGWFREFTTTIRTIFYYVLFHLFAITIRRCSLKQPTEYVVKEIINTDFKGPPNIPDRVHGLPLDHTLSRMRQPTLSRLVSLLFISC